MTTLTTNTYKIVTGGDGYMPSMKTIRAAYFDAGEDTRTAFAVFKDEQHGAIYAVPASSVISIERVDPEQQDQHSMA